MDCPFPGMDPYLEQTGVWPDFHSRFLTYAAELLAEHAPRPYDIRLEQQLRLVEVPPEGPTISRPDLWVTKGTGARPGRFAGAGGAAVLEPEILPLAATEWEEVRDVRLVVSKSPGRELVTVVELLSPWNKTTEGMTDFVRKRRATLAGKAHWVEIDLLTGGQRTPLGVPRPAGDFFAQVVRTERPQQAEVYSWGLRAALPDVPIPLRAPDGDLTLPLGEVFRLTYRKARLDIPLSELPPGPPRGPWSAEDAAWAAALAAPRFEAV